MKIKTIDPARYCLDCRSGFSPTSRTEVRPTATFNSCRINKPMPSLTSDAKAEAFVATADLSQYELSGFKPMHVEIAPKSAALTMRLPMALLEALKNKAKSKGIPYTRYVQMLLESDVTQ